MPEETDEGLCPHYHYSGSIYPAASRTMRILENFSLHGPMKHASAMRRGRTVGAKRARGVAAHARWMRGRTCDEMRHMELPKYFDTVTPSPLPRVTWSAYLIHLFIEYTPPMQAECGVDIRSTSCYMNRRGTQSPAASHTPPTPPQPSLMPRLLAQLLAIWHLCGDDPVGLGLVPN